MTGSVSEFERDGDTLAPPPDSETTSPHHEIPSSVGQPPSDIPQAPEPMREILEALNEIRDDVRAVRNDDRVGKLMAQIAEMNANLQLAVNEFKSHRATTDARLLEQDEKIKTLTKHVEELKHKVSELERELDRLIDDGR